MVVMTEKRLPFNKQTAVVLEGKKGEPAGWDSVLGEMFQARAAIEYGPHRVIFSQGDPSTTVFYIQSGWVKLTVVSEKGKEVTKAILEAGDFFGEKCLAGLPLRLATAVTLTDCSLVRIEKAAMLRVLHESPRFSELFAEYLLWRSIRSEQDLVNQLFNNSEKRLARTLVRLSHIDNENKFDSTIPRLGQETLAQMVGTTRSRVSHFMHKFRKLGFIEYSHAELRVHRSILEMICPTDSASGNMVPASTAGNKAGLRLLKRDPHDEENRSDCCIDSGFIPGSHHQPPAPDWSGPVPPCDRR